MRTKRTPGKLESPFNSFSWTPLYHTSPQTQYSSFCLARNAPWTPEFSLRGQPSVFLIPFLPSTYRNSVPCPPRGLLSLCSADTSLQRTSKPEDGINFLKLNVMLPSHLRISCQGGRRKKWPFGPLWVLIACCSLHSNV